MNLRVNAEGEKKANTRVYMVTSWDGGMVWTREACRNLTSATKILYLNLSGGYRGVYICIKIIKQYTIYNWCTSPYLCYTLIFKTEHNKNIQHNNNIQRIKGKWKSMWNFTREPINVSKHRQWIDSLLLTKIV